jgi:hypothetical protein
MSIVRPRIQVTLDADTSGLLATLAQQEHQSVSATAARLIKEALEIQEELYFSRLADERHQAVLKGAKLLSHAEVWGE